MITYKPSSRLGLLNEENFTSDPTSRGWAVTSSGTGASSFGADGAKITCTSLESLTLILENSTTKLSNFISFTLSGGGNNYAIDIYWKCYINDILVGISPITSVTPNNTGLYGSFYLFKNKPTDWKQNNMFVVIKSNNTGEVSTNFASINPGISVANKIKLELNVTCGNGDQGNLSLTNLKWI